VSNICCHGHEETRRKRALKTQENIMKTVVSALIALAVLVGVAASAGAHLDAKRFFDQQTRQGR
jgi:hypothetical protein